MSKHKIGTITLGEETFLSDPCYGYNLGGNASINTLAGEYNVFVTRSESTSRFLANRISSIMVVHKDFKNFVKMPKNDKENLYCAVDSGTCGIFDYEYYKKYHNEKDVDDDWYDNFVINRMVDTIITDNKGAISSSGLGDGCYPVFAEYVNNKAYAIRICFL